MPKSVLPFDVVEDVESDVLAHNAPATQTQAILFGGIQVFVPSLVQLGGFERLADLVGQTIAILGSRGVTLRSGESFAWTFVRRDGSKSEFLSSSPQLITLEEYIERMGQAALVQVEKGDDWTDDRGITRPSFRFTPGNPGQTT